MFYAALLGVMFCLFILEFFSVTVYLSRSNDVLVKILSIFYWKCFYDGQITVATTGYLQI